MAPLICPDCDGRIGNRRATCKTCNRFAQAVHRKVCSRLHEAHNDTADALRSVVEAEVYANLTVTPTGPK